MDQQITLEFPIGLARASQEAEVSEALEELADTKIIVRRFGDVRDEDLAYRGIAEFALREAGKLRALRSDLSLRRFNQRERDLLERHPNGRDLLARLADGDESAVAPFTDLLAEIKRARAELGLT